MPEEIPLHSLLRLKEEIIPFELSPLHTSSGYDSRESHGHSYYEIFFFEKGGGQHLIDFNWFPIHDHSVHFLSPGQVHQLKDIKDAIGTVLLFSEDFYHLEQSGKNLLYKCPLLNNYSQTPILNLGEEDFKSLYHYAKVIASEKEEVKSYSQEICLSNLHLLIAQASRFYEMVTASLVEKENSIYRNFRVLLENNYHTWHKTDDYSSALSISEKTLNRRVKSASGKSAVEHIRSRILLESKRLLHNSEASIKEIAYALNFNDPSHFSKFFKEYEGVNPSDFRSKTSE